MQVKRDCEVCGNTNLPIVLDLGEHPLCDDLIPQGNDAVCKEYPIQISFCDTCLTAHQVYQPPKTELFGSDYHYRARMTGSVLTGMANLVDSCEQQIGSLAGLKVLDIGCNDGSLLDIFKSKGATTLGIEPTGAAKESAHQTINAFFDRDSAEQARAILGEVDIITFTNVFAHIEDLPGLIANLRILIGPKTHLVIENHYLGAVLKYGQFDTFYHEHPRTYSAASFDHIAKQLGLVLNKVQFVTRYGGNIRVFMSNNPEAHEAIDESHIEAQIRGLQGHMEAWRDTTRAQIDALVAQYGPLVGKAFPGRAAILIKLLGLSTSDVSAVYEIKGSKKVDHYLPGTRIPIRPEAELFAKPNDGHPILNLAWHIPAEVRANLDKNGMTNPVVDIKPFVEIA